MNTTINIKGMSCGHCAMRVTRALESVSGVSNVYISLENMCADVEYDDAAVTREMLVEAVENTGFDVVG